MLYHIMLIIRLRFTPNFIIGFAMNLRLLSFCLRHFISHIWSWTLGCILALMGDLKFQKKILSLVCGICVKIFLFHCSISSYVSHTMISRCMKFHTSWSVVGYSRVEGTRLFLTRNGQELKNVEKYWIKHKTRLRRMKSFPLSMLLITIFTSFHLFVSDWDKGR